MDGLSPVTEYRFVLDDYPKFSEDRLIVKRLKSGQQVDQFRIVRKLGEGGMSEVYLARDVKLGRKVALKIIRAELADSPQRLELFFNEARLTAKFSHPHIIAIHTVGEFEGYPYLALEYLEGQTLARRMGEGAISARETMRIGLAIAQALAEAHSHGVLHRDLKPANVVIAQDGRLRVLDFGVSKIIEDSIHSPDPARDLAREVKPEETASGEIKGTPNYIAPERWLGGKVTGESDVWALGVILFRALTQAHPYPGEDRRVDSIARRIVSAQKPPSLPQDLNVPSELSQLITSMLEAETSRRPTAKQVVEVFQRLLRGKHDKQLENKSPFRGLLPFSERHADLFFGRSAEIEMAVERLRHEPILPVVGPSGAGKSSFVAAGIVPRLRDLERWLVLTVRPGTDPFGALGSILQAGWRGDLGNTTLRLSSAPLNFLPRNTDRNATADAVENESVQQGKDRSEETDLELTGIVNKAPISVTSSRHQGLQLAGSPSSRVNAVGELANMLQQSPATLLLELLSLADETRCKVLLFVDQLEELYTQDHRPDLRRAFMEAILRAADDPDGPIRVIYTLREDFLSRVMEGCSAQETLTQIMVLGAPGEHALFETITKPLELAGYSYEDDGLAQEMLDAVLDAPASLPLLQFACSQLWNRRDAAKRILTRSAFAEIGGVEGALASKADELLGGLTEVQQKVFKQLILRLVTPEGTRRVMAFEELRDGLDSSAPVVLHRLTEARMVVSRRAASREDAEAEFELVHDSLIRNWKPLVRWLEQSREEVVFLDEVSRAAELWDSRGCPVEEVWSGDALDEALAKLKRCEAVPQRVSEFIKAGLLRRQARAKRRRRIIFAGFSVLLAVIAVLAIVIREVDIQREIAENQRDREQQARASALREGARAAFTKGDFLEARSKLRASLEARDSIQARALWWLLESEPLVWSKSLGEFVNWVSASPDGRWLAASTAHGLIYLYDIKTLEQLVLRGHKGQTLGIDFSPDGRWLVSGAYDCDVRLWDLKEGTVKVLKGHTNSVRSTHFSPGGAATRFVSGSYDRTIKIWDIESDTPIRTLKSEDDVEYARFTADGRFIISTNRKSKIRIWNAQSYELDRVIEEPGMRIDDAVTSRDGKLLLYGSSDGVLVIRDFEKGTEIKRISNSSRSIGSLSFSPDDAFVAVGSRDGKVRIRDTKTWSLRGYYHHSKDPVNSVAFLPDGEQLVSSGDDGMVKLWKMGVDSFRKENAGHVAPIYAIAFAHDGKTIVTGSTNGVLHYWNVASGQSFRRITGHDGPITNIEFQPNGNLLSSAAYDGNIRLWNFADGKLWKTLMGHNNIVSSIVFFPDGKKLVSSGFDNAIIFWDLERFSQYKSISTEYTGYMDLDPNGHLLASSCSGKIEVRDVETSEVLQTFSGHTAGIKSISFSPDGESLYSASYDYTVRRYQIGSTLTQGRVVARHQGNIYWIDVTASTEDILGTASADMTAKIWKVETGDVITLTGHQNEVNRLKFSPDGTIAATASDDSTVRLWDTKTGRPLWHSPLMFGDPPMLLTQQGWTSFEDDANPSPSTKQWQKAVERSGKLASVSAEQDTVCLATYSDELEVWKIADDTRSFRAKHAGIDQVLAIRNGCAFRTDDTLTITASSGVQRNVASKVETVSRHEDTLMVLADGKVRVLDLEGNQQDEFTVTHGVSSLTIVGESVVLGFADGSIEVWRRYAANSRRILSLKEVEVSPVTTLIPGPPSTVIAGFGNGSIGIWSLETGTRLYTQHLHGPVIHLLHQDRILWAATELGSRLQLDLSTFYSGYCELMERVWTSVPWVWDEGQPRLHERPNDHICRSHR